MRKRALSVVMALVLILTMLPYSSLYAEELEQTIPAAVLSEEIEDNMEEAAPEGEEGVDSEKTVSASSEKTTGEDEATISSEDEKTLTEDETIDPVISNEAETTEPVFLGEAENFREEGRTFSLMSAPPTVTVEKVNAFPGSNAVVNVSIADNPGIMAASLTFDFGQELTLVSADSGEAFSALDFTRPGSFASPAKFLFDAMSIGDDDIKDGTILTLTFIVSDSADVGSEFPVKITAVDAKNKLMQNLELQIVNGAVTVLDYVPGDLNGDGKVKPTDTVLMRRHYVGGYEQTINEDAADVNGDGTIGLADIVYERQFIAGGYPDWEDPSKPLWLRPAQKKCQHELEEFEYLAPSCTVNGHFQYWHCTVCDKYFLNEEATQETDLEKTIIAATGHKLEEVAAKEAGCTEGGIISHWHCSSCNKYFSDADAENEITVESIYISARGHSFSESWTYDKTYHWHAATCEHTNLVSDRAEHSFNESGICEACGAQEGTDPSKPYKIEYKIVEWNANKGDDYIATQAISNNPANLTSISDSDSFELQILECPGYEFLGWYNSNEEKVTHINAGTNQNITLWAHWKLHPYKITYKTYGTPLEYTEVPSTFTEFYVNEGKPNLYKPDPKNYIFLGWYDEEGNEVSSIPVGTTKDIVLNPYLTSQRYLTKAITPKSTAILEDLDNNVLYFAYEIGTIDNVPLDVLTSFNTVADLSSSISRTVETEVSGTMTNNITENIAKATTESGTWSLANEWGKTFNISEESYDSDNITQEEAKRNAQTSTGSYSLTQSQGGNSSHTDNSGTTTLEYDSKHEVNDDTLEWKAEGHLDINAKVKFPAGIANVQIGGNIGGSLERDHTTYSSTDEHSGSDTTTVNTHVDVTNNSWNKDQNWTTTKQDMSEESTRMALSKTISKTTGYGQSYLQSGSENETSAFSSSENQSMSSSTTWTYFNSKRTIDTTTYSSNGRAAGNYREVTAGTLHVFGIAGYDVATKEYFAYSLSVLDDRIKTFLDYAPANNPGFNDCAYGAIPFEIPYEVFEYVSTRAYHTEGLDFRADIESGTASVRSYDGESSEVNVPAFIEQDGHAYRVVGLEEKAFENAAITKVVLSPFITEIPKDAFKGCTSLENFVVASNVTSIGTDAFKGVPNLRINALSAEEALAFVEKVHPDLAIDEEDSEEVKLEKRISLNEKARELTCDLVNSALQSGAENITLDISKIMTDTALTLNVPDMESFKLVGGGKTYKDLRLKSVADSTTLERLIIKDCTRIPLETSSGELSLSYVNITSPSYVALLSARNIALHVYGDNILKSENGNLAVAGVMNLFYETGTSGSRGYLYTYGNIYTLSDKADINLSRTRINEGDIVTVSEDKYEAYIRGTYTLNFNPNGGISSISKKEVYNGTAVGVLPIATRDFYTFDGWYTSAEGGERISENNVYSDGLDRTAYAHWRLNDMSTWVQESELPAGASIVNTKYTYTLREHTSGGSPTLSGWNWYDTQQTSWSVYGPWSAWSFSEAVNSESRQVECRSVESEYLLRSYTYSDGAGNRHYRRDTTSSYSLRYGPRVFWVSADTLSTLPTASQGSWYGGSNAGYVDGPGTGYITHNGDYVVIPFFIADISYRNQYRYRDRSPVYTYFFYRDLALETDSDPSGQSNVSNVQKWVQYRAQ